MKMNKSILILLITALLLLPGCDSDAAKGGISGKPPKDDSACIADLAEANNTIDTLQSQITALQSENTQCNDVLSITQNTLNGLEADYLACNNSLSLTQETLALLEISYADCNDALTVIGINYAECQDLINTCEKFYPSLGQFGVGDTMVAYTTVEYQTQEQLNVTCETPSVIMNDIYDWGPNNPINGVYNSKLDGVERCYCGVGYMCYKLI